MEHSHDNMRCGGVNRVAVAPRSLLGTTPVTAKVEAEVWGGICAASRILACLAGCAPMRVGDTQV